MWFPETSSFVGCIISFWFATQITGLFLVVFGSCDYSNDLFIYWQHSIQNLSSCIFQKVEFLLLSWFNLCNLSSINFHFLTSLYSWIALLRNLAWTYKLQDQIIAYTFIVLQPELKLKLCELGHELKSPLLLLPVKRVDIGNIKSTDSSRSSHSSKRTKTEPQSSRPSWLCLIIFFLLVNRRNVREFNTEGARIRHKTAVHFDAVTMAEQPGPDPL